MSLPFRRAQLSRRINTVAPSPPTIQPIVYEPEAVTYFAALTTSGLTLNDARKYTLNRAIKRWKAAGLHTKADFGVAMSASAFAVSAFGLYTMTKVGTPTFSGFTVSTASNADYYEIDKQFKDIDPTDHSMGFLAIAGSAASANSDMGVTDGTIRLAINSKATTTNVFTAWSFSTSVSMGTTAQSSGNGFNAISRHPSTPGSFYQYTNGIMRSSSATATSSTASTNKVRVLMLGGGTTVSSRTMASWFFGKGLTHDELVLVYAILKSIDNAIRYGEPQIEDAGYGTAIVQADVVVIGVTISAICAAYQATRLGRTVVLVGKEGDTSPEHIGFNPVGRVDSADPTTINGLARAIITAANTQAGLTDSTDQQGCSVHPMRWARFAHQMLDPTRTGGTLPGADIKVYFSPGIDSATIATTAIGRECTELVAKDGRIYRPLGSRMIVINADYDGDVIAVLGISYTKGTEAKGTAPGEDLNGFAPAALFPLRDINGNSYNTVSPYVVDGVSGSGLLPNIIVLPSITTGDPDPILQPMNFRMIVTNTAYRMAPMTGGATLAPPINYSAQNYEALGRLFAAYTAGGHTPSLADVVALGNSVEGASGNVFDWNNGSSGISTDLGQSGRDYLQAATQAQRLAVIKNLKQYTHGLFYWLLASGDPRIPPSLITALNAYGMDTAWGCDPSPGDPLFYPPGPYKREPAYQMRNTFNFSGHDTFAADGTTPRSIKTVACAAYRADRHTTRWVDIAGVLMRQGGINDSSAGGVNERAPVPLEAIVPDKAECANFISTTSIACTKVANSTLRMEPTYDLLGQSAGVIADHALTEAVAVQDIDYASYRTTMLAVPDASTPVLPQVN